MRTNIYLNHFRRIAGAREGQTCSAPSMRPSSGRSAAHDRFMNEIADYNISQPSSIGFSAFEAGRYPRTTGKAFEMLSRKHEIATQPIPPFNIPFRHL